MNTIDILNNLVNLFFESVSVENDTTANCHKDFISYFDEVVGENKHTGNIAQLNHYHSAINAVWYASTLFNDDDEEAHADRKLGLLRTAYFTKIH